MKISHKNISQFFNKLVGRFSIIGQSKKLVSKKRKLVGPKIRVRVE